MADFDVVIVGAGHNGLTAGCYLARNGRRVIVVERGSKVGGMTTSGFMIPEAPQHLVTPARSMLFSCAAQASSRIWNW